MPFRRIVAVCIFIFLAAGWIWTFTLYRNEQRESYEWWERWFFIDVALEFIRETEGQIQSGDFEALPGAVEYIEFWGRKGSEPIEGLDPTMAAFCEWQVYALHDDLKVVLSDDFVANLLARLSDEDVENLAAHRDFNVSEYGVDFSEHRVKVGEGLKTFLFERMREAMEETSG